MPSKIDKVLGRLVQRGEDAKIDKLAASTEEEELLETLDAADVDSRDELEKRAERLRELVDAGKLSSGRGDLSHA